MSEPGLGLPLLREPPAPVARQEVVIVGIDMPLSTWVNVMAMAMLAWFLASLLGLILLGLVGVGVFGAMSVISGIAERRAVERAQVLPDEGE